MTSPEENYQAALAPTASVRGIAYFRLITYVFDHPQWGMNLLLGTVCQFIPIIGNILLIGYQFEIVEALHRGHARYPEFNFDRFVPYLYRGLWPFLVNLVVTLILVPFMLLGVLGLVLLANLLGLNEDLAMLVIGLPAMAFAMLLSVLLALVMMPMAIGAGLSQTFQAGFRGRFILDFISKVWPQMLAGVLFLVIASMTMIVVGMLLCFVGVYPAVTITMLAQAHLYFQLYRLYLQRGGTPVPLAGK